jgi:hypothetical protein
MHLLHWRLGGWPKPLLLLTAVLLSAASLHAEIWCGQGPSTLLDHPCVPPSEAAVSRVVLKYRNAWIALTGVSSVELAKSQNGEEIRVRVGPDFANPNRGRIPPSADGIPVVILPASAATGDFIVRSFPRPSGDNGSRSRTRSEDAYLEVIHNSGERWLALPGVIGIGPVDCADDGCDFGSVGISVQRQLLGSARKQIPSSVDGVPIVLIPRG